MNKSIDEVDVITGVAATREVFFDDERLNPRPSQVVQNFNANGFGWGRNDDLGAAQLALAILLRFMGDSHQAMEALYPFRSGRDPRGAGPLLALTPALPQIPELGLQRLARRPLFL